MTILVKFTKLVKGNDASLYNNAMLVSAHELFKHFYPILPMSLRVNKKNYPKNHF